MIKVNAKPYRRTTADWILFNGSEEETVQIAVEYYTLTVKQIKEHQDALAARQAQNPDAFVWLSEILLPRLKALPDLVDENEKPIEITLEFLESQDVRNLKNIQESINNDESPKSPGDSLPAA